MRTGKRKSKWSAKQRRFIHWLVLPEGKRSPRTQAELARELKLRQETLSRWERLPGFYDAVKVEAFRRLLSRIPIVLDVIGEKAEAGNIQYVKLLMELNERFQVRFGKTAESFTSEELAKAALEIEDWKNERFGSQARV